MAPSDISCGTPPEDGLRTPFQQPHPPVAADAGSLRIILVVDDQPGVATTVAFFLQKCGYRTHRADSGYAALEFLGSTPVDGVLLDIQMPKMNGFETCVRLHELARAAGRPLKIWFMTGMYYPELQEECAKVGGLGIFQKPFDWPLLLAELDRGFGAAPGRPSAPGETIPESL